MCVQHYIMCGDVANVGSGVIITLLRPAGDSDESSVQCTVDQSG